MSDNVVTIWCSGTRAMFEPTREVYKVTGRKGRDTVVINLSTRKND